MAISVDRRGALEWVGGWFGGVGILEIWGLS